MWVLFIHDLESKEFSTETTGGKTSWTYSHFWLSAYWGSASNISA